MRAYVVRTMGHASHADDIVQEAYLRILRKPVPTRDDDELRAYLFRTASNLVIDRWRSRKHESPDVPPERSAQGPDQVLRLDVGRLFARLKPRERQMMWLAHVEGADHREIAAMLAMRELADTPVDAGSLPDPSFIWWKAQLLRRHDAEHDAIAPIEVGDQMHIGGAILGAIALALGAWSYVPTLAFTPVIALTVAGSALILLTVLAVAALESLRDR